MRNERKSTARPRILISKTTLAALPVPETTVVVWDTDLRGFGVKLSPGGARSYLIQRRLRSGAEVKLGLGRCNEVPVARAREEAKRLIAEIALGGDPAKARRDSRKAVRERKAGITVATLAEQWQAACGPSWRPATRRNYGNWLRLHVVPHIGRKKVRDVTGFDILRCYRAAPGASTANRVASVSSSMFGWAVEQRIVDSNPCLNAIPKGTRHVEHQRESRPMGNELEKLAETLRGRDDLASRYFEFLLLTGARRGETGEMRWRDVDLDAGVWLKPASTTKQKRTHRLPLNPEAVALLRELQPAEQLWPADGPFLAVTDTRARKEWQAIREETGIKDLRVHDLRHWHASLLGDDGHSLLVIGALLGISTPKQITKYVSLNNKTLNSATDGIGKRMRRLRSRPAVTTDSCGEWCRTCLETGSSHVR